MSAFEARAEFDNAKFLDLYRRGLVPIYASLVGLAWIWYDFFMTIKPEVEYIWPHKRGISKITYFWIRYYSLALVAFDVTQIHVFASTPNIRTDNACVLIDPITRTAGAILLWSIEVVMQQRVYALYRCSKKIAVFNGILFLASIAAWFWIMIHNYRLRRANIADALHLPLKGCPAINGAIEWALWIPAIGFEVILFCFALYRAIETQALEFKMGRRVSLYALFLRDNILYFIGVTCVLVFNLLMVVGVTGIPWFSYGPFHAALGVMTVRMLLHAHKAASRRVILGSADTELSEISKGLPQHRESTMPSMAFHQRSGTDTEMTSHGEKA